MKIKSISSGSHGNCYLVELCSGRVLLLECGISINKILPELSSIPDFCLVTHEHGDHAKSIKSVADAGIPIVCSEGTAHATNLEAYEYETYVEGIRMLSAEHNAEEPVMFVVDDSGERLFFVTDTSEIRHTVYGITHLMIEANWSSWLISDEELEEGHNKRIEHSHMSLEKAVEWIDSLDKSKLEKIILCHLSSRYSDVRLFVDTVSKLVPGVEVEIA